MSFFLADFAGGFSAASLSGASSPTRGGTSSSSTTTATTTPIISTAIPASSSSSSSSLSTVPRTPPSSPAVIWSGWDVLDWPADLWTCGDGKAVRQPGALARMLPLADEEGAASSLADRRPRAGQVKRKRAEFEGALEGASGAGIDHKGVCRTLDLVRPGADNLRALVNVLAREVASDLAPGQAREVGRELALQLGAADTTDADRDEVLAGMMRGALACPTRSAALSAMASALGEGLRGQGQRIPFSFVDALFTQAAQLSLAPMADHGSLVPGGPDVSGRLGPLKVLLGVLRMPRMTPEYLAWFRSSVAAWVAPALAGDAQDLAVGQRTQPVRLLGAVARAFVADGDTEVGHALSVDFLNALGGVDDLAARHGCELLVEGLGGDPADALGLLMKLTPRLENAPSQRLFQWLGEGSIWPLAGPDAES